jgi:hypothetical protein
MSSHRASHSIESYIPYLPELTEPMESPGLCRHPTFLSTTSTPSPPPSPPTMSRLAFPNPLRSNPVSPRDRTDLPVSSLPLSPPWTANGIWANSASSNGKQALPSLTPLVLSPPTLKPSTKPPLSLNPPNPTTRRNFSPTTPQNDFPADFPISGYRHKTTVSPIRTGSHSASASLTMSYPPQVQPPKGLKQRSPSQPSLPTYFPSNDSPPGPPPIPLRMSSIPANSKPRKLSLPIHRSTSTLKAVRNSSEEKESATTPRDVGLTPPRKVSPPIRKNKALPSPPMTAEEESRTREKVVGTSPQQEWDTYSSQRRTSDSENRGGQVWAITNDHADHPGIAGLPASSAKLRTTPSRLNSAPTSAALKSPYQIPEMQALFSSSAGPKSQPYPTTQPFASSNVTPPLRDTIIPKAAKSSAKPPKPQNLKGKTETTKQVETGSWAAATQQLNEGRPVQLSRTQKDKERKKRSKASVLMDHVDIIKDEFWEKRPWILSGKTTG